MKTYAEKLKNPRWQKKRLKVLERDDFKCQLCWNQDEMLVVHHKYYKRGKEPWDYPIKALITLCNSCHEKLKPVNNKKEVVYPDNYNRFIRVSEILKKYSDMIKISNDGMKFIAVAKNLKSCMMYVDNKDSDKHWDFEAFSGYVEDNYKEIEKDVIQNARSSFFDKYKNN